MTQDQPVVAPSRQERRPLRVALPMFTLVPGGMGGTQTLVTELVEGLAKHPDVDVRMGLSASATEFASLGDALVADKVAGGSSNLARLTSQLRAELSSDVRRFVRDADLVHYPLTVPTPRPPRGKPLVISLHDVQHLDLPENFSTAERLYRKPRYDLPPRKADAVITLSEFSKQRIVHHLGIDPARIHVAYLGVDIDEFTPNLGPREDFVLYPARGWPHKNHPRLVEAMKLVRQTHPHLRLVLTGGGRSALDDPPDWVETRGLISREELVALYQRAACMAFPSLYEGFGLPPIEAMASGCPVASSDAGSLPEIVGDAATSYDATDVSAIARGITDALDNGHTLAQRGLARAREFTWSQCVDDHVRIYQDVFEASRG